MTTAFRKVELESNNNLVNDNNPLPVVSGLTIPNYDSYSINISDKNNIIITYIKDSVTIATETIGITANEITVEVS